VAPCQRLDELPRLHIEHLKGAAAGMEERGAIIGCCQLAGLAGAVERVGVVHQHVPARIVLGVGSSW
jgi:hypothetical protein